MKADLLLFTASPAQMVCAVCGETIEIGADRLDISVGLSQDEAVHPRCASLEEGLVRERADLCQVQTSVPNRAWVKQGRVLLTVPYHPDWFQDLKSINGRSYSLQPIPHWSFPQAEASRVLLIARRWTDFRVSPELQSASRIRGRSLSIVEEGIRLDAPYSRSGIEAVKQIPGAFFRDPSKDWILPLEYIETAIDVVQTHWPQLDIDPQLYQQREAEKVASRTAISVESEQNISFPGGLQLRGYQTQGVRFLEARRGRALLADDMGLGKTIQILAYHRLSGGKMVVFSPSAVRINWAREALVWSNLDPSQIVVGGVGATRRRPFPFVCQKKPGPLPEETRIFVINYESIHLWAPFIARHQFDILACDEAHYLSNMHSRRSNTARYLRYGVQGEYEIQKWIPKPWIIEHQPPVQGGRPPRHRIRIDRKTPGGPVATDWASFHFDDDPRALADLLIAARSMGAPIPGIDPTYPGIPRIILGTGTPIENRTSGLWHLLHLIDRVAWGGKNGGWKAFTARYQGARKNHRGHWTLGKRGTHLDELNERLLGSYMARRLKTQALKDLPPKNIHRVFLEPSFKDLRPYHDLVDTIDVLRRSYEDRKAQVKLLGAGVEEDEEARSMLGQLLGLGAQLRSVLGSCKIPAVVDWIQQLVDSDEPAVVFAWHQDVQKALYAALAKLAPSGHIFSSDSAADRDAAVQAFQSGSIRYLICSIQAANAGLTLTRANHTVHVERAWNPAQNRQSEDRIHRIGQDGACFSWYLDVPGTVDDGMHELCAEKQQDQDLVIDGRTFSRTGNPLTQRAIIARTIQIDLEDLDAL